MYLPYNFQGMPHNNHDILASAQEGILHPAGTGPIPEIEIRTMETAIPVSIRVRIRELGRLVLLSLDLLESQQPLSLASLLFCDQEVHP
jgi:hypothetical protein